MIGIFDSGFGGLTMLKEFINYPGLKEYDYAYLGDNVRAPYGDKSPAVIYQYSKQAVDFLFKQGCELIIIACNTASADALRKIQQEYLPQNYPDKKVLGVIIPLIEAVVDSARSASRQKQDKGLIGVIGTKYTIKSGVYERELKKATDAFEIYGLACPLLVPLIEENWIKKPETRMILKKYLRQLKEKNIKTLILGCTHYPILIKDIKKIMGKNIEVLNSPRVVADKLSDYLIKHREIESKIGKSKKRQYYTTDNEAKFENAGSRFLGQSITKVKRVEMY